MRHRTSVTYFDSKFTVNGNKVKCELTYGINLYKCPLIIVTIQKYKHIFKYLYNKDGSIVYKIHNGQLYAMFKCTGTASCSPNDVFNEVTGQHIAETAAQRKAFMRTQKFYRDYSNALQDEAAKANIYALQCCFTEAHLNRHIKKLRK